MDGERHRHVTQKYSKRISVWEVSIQVFTAKLFRLCSVFEIFTVKKLGGKRDPTY